MTTQRILATHALLGLMAVVACPESRATLSPPTRFVADSEHSLLWRTYGGADGIRWNWPTAAQSAKLTVTGKNGTTSTVYAPPTCVYFPCVPLAAADEDVIGLELVFYASSDATGEPLSGETLSASGIGLVRGTDGGTVDYHSADASSRAWRRIRDKSAVLPVPEGTTALSIGGAAQTVEFVPGWFLWSPIVPSPATTVALTTDGECSETTLRCGILGLQLSIR